MKTQEILTALESKHPGEHEYLQAVREVLLSIEDVYNQHPEFERVKLIERLVEPDRIITFRVPSTTPLARTRAACVSTPPSISAS